MNKCPACGGELTYLVEEQKVYCEYCRSSFNPSEFKSLDKFANKRKTTEGTLYTCRECGASLLTFDETAVTFCSYCGSQAMLESNMMEINNPDYIIPFKKSKEECINEYKKLMNRSLFVPSYMKKDVEIEKFRGIFMPYAIYKTSFHGTSVNNGERYGHRSGDYVIYDKYDITAQVDADYEGVSYDVLSIFYDEYSKSIPFNYNEAVEYNKNYLSGFYADTKDVDLEVYDHLALDITTNDTKNRLKNKREYSSYGCYNPKVNLKISDRKVGMFPVYFLAVRNKTNDKIHYAVVNGQTGKVTADLPIDFFKYVIASLVLALIIYLFMENLSVILPTTALIFSMVSALVSLIISNYQLNKIFTKENKLDDLGYKSSIDNENEKVKLTSKDTTDFKGTISIFLIIALGVYIVFIFPITELLGTVSIFIPIISIIGLSIVNKKEISISSVKKEKYKMPFNQKLKYIYKQLVAILLGIIVFIMYPVSDRPYYIAAFAILAIILLSFYDLIKEHNMFASNKIPQLNKRGGDEREK